METTAEISKLHKAFENELFILDYFSNVVQR